MISDLLQIIFNIAANNNVPIVLIGGLALPAYNITRTTLEIDICINLKPQEELNRFIGALKQNGISTVQKPKISHNLFTVEKRGEAEIWLKPCDAFSWD